MNKHFANIDELVALMQEKKRGAIPIVYHLLQEYAGMVLYIGIVFDIKKTKYELNLEWISLGLDLYGDTLQEGYLYKFDNLEKLIKYLHLKYDIKVTEIPLKFEFDSDQFPNPIKNASQKSIFEMAWNKFQKDFEKKIFLDNSLDLAS